MARHGRYYDCEMQDADHAQLLNRLLGLKGMVVLSGYSGEMYLDALQGWAMASTEARISAARGTAIRTECLWLNPAASHAQSHRPIFRGGSMRQRQYSIHAVQPRATRRRQDAADDAFHFEQARRRRENAAAVTEEAKAIDEQLLNVEPIPDKKKGGIE